MIKVLQVNSTIAYNSGVMKVVMNYYSYINRSEINFDFLYFLELNEDAISYENEIREKGGNVFFIPHFTRFNSFNKSLKDCLKNNKYDIVHVHDPFVLRFIYKTLRECDIKHIIVHSHSTRWSEKTLNAVRNYIVCRNLDKYIDYRFACSKAAGEFLYGKNKKFYVMNNAIDKQKYSFNCDDRKIIRNNYGLEDKIVFGHVGSFLKTKNHLFLIEIFVEILKIHPQSILMLLGDGPLRAVVEDKILKYGINDNVILLGKRQDVEKYYQAMDCLILPSLFEGLPMVGVESQCSGLPVVFSDKITREIAFEKSCYLSLKESPQIWAKAALQLAKDNSVLDRKLAVKELENLNFDILRECKKLERKYYEILAE